MNTKTLALAAATVLAVTGCTQAQRVSGNISTENLDARTEPRPSDG